MKVRRYKYILTKVVEEEHIPRKRRRTILPVLLRPVKPRPPEYKLALPRPAPTRPQPGRLPPLVLKSLPLAILGVLTILMMTVLACALVGLFTLPTPEQNVVLTRRPVMIGRHLPTLTPTPAAAQVVVTLPTPAADNAVLPPATPTATPPPLLTPTNAYTAPPSAAGNQNNSRPTLTSLVTLNVRSGPGLDHNVVGKLAVGQSTSITGQNPDGSWWQIEYPSGSGQQAWVSANPQYSTVSRTMPQTIAQASTPAGTPPPPPPAQIPDTSGWAFNGVTNVAGNSEEGLLLMGELVNNTGAPQQVIDISGAFYDAQGEDTVNSLNVVSYVPVDPVPVDAHIPFYLQVDGRRDIDHFDLNALSEPASDPPRQDFQFSGVEQWVDDDTGYCLRGQVDNQGPPVQEYLIVVAIGYDDQGSVVNFGEYYVDTLPGSDGQSSPFELCLASPGRQLNRHDLRVFGY